MTIAEQITRAKTDYDEVKESGKQAEYDRFWDAYQQKGKRTNYAYAFAGQCWTPDTLKPKYPIAPKWGGAGMMFYNSAYEGSLKDLPLDFSQLSGMNYTFYNAAGITEIPLIDASNCSQMMCDFQNCTALHTLSLRVSEKITTYADAFSGCSSLKNLTIEGVIGSSINFRWSPLSKESITSVINALSSSVTGQTATFKKSAKEAAFTADEWAELIATKTNWTFSLV
jgi:hypothetical protein